MSQFRKQPGYRVYLLRFWQEPREKPDLPNVWRFSLQDPRTGERRGFASLEALVAFLAQEIQRAEKETDS